MMSTSKTIIFAIILAVSEAVGHAQEVTYLDLTGVTPRSELRYPHAPPTKCNEKGVCASGGFGGMSISCGGVARGQLRTSLSWMDRSEYVDGENAEIEAMIENVGDVPLEIPSTFHLAHLQPPDETEKFEVYTLQVGLFLNRGEQYSTSLGWLGLYGSAARTGSMVNLKPGEWVRIRGRISISLAHADGMKLPPPDGSQRASASILLRRIEYQPHPGGISQSISIFNPGKLKGTDLQIRVLPAADASN
jgi:hypothetical protein